MADGMKKCPYCAEMIQSEATKCRYCGSVLDAPRPVDPHEGHWRRVNSGKMIAGVCTGLAREFNTPQAVLPLRIFFVLSVLFYSFGIILYILLWILMPAPTDKPYRAAAPVPPEPQPSAHASSPGNIASQTSESPPRRSGSRTSDTLISLALILAGIMFMLITFSRGHGWDFLPSFGWGQHSPFGGLFEYPGVMFHNLSWIPGLWFALIMAGLLVILFGALKIFRFVLGCGLILVGGFLLLVFVPFIPGVLFFPVMLIVGMLLLLIGIIKMIV